MDTTQRNISLQVQFWAFLGPLISLVTMMVLFVKGSTQAHYLSFATVAGVLTSWKWKERGFLFSCVAILAFYIYQYGDMHPDERLWNLGMSFAMAIGFGITALTYQEVDDLVSAADEEENVDELKATLKLVQQEIAAKHEQIESYHQLVETARQEVSKVSQQHQKLLKDFLDKQLECSQLQEKLSNSVSQGDAAFLQHQLHTAQERIHLLSEQQALSSELGEALAKREEEIVSLKNQIQDLEHELARVLEEKSNQIHMEKLENQQIVHEMQMQVQQVEAHLMSKDQELAQRQIHIQGLEKQESEYKVMLQEKESQLAAKLEQIQLLQMQEDELKNLLKEKEAILVSKQAEIQSLQRELEEKAAIPVTFEEYSTGEVRRLEGMLKQLKAQFEEKSATLDQARKELFYTQEKLSGLQREYEETRIYDVDENTQAMQSYIKSIIIESERLEEEVASLHEVINSLTA